MSTGRAKEPKEPPGDNSLSFSSKEAGRPQAPSKQYIEVYRIVDNGPGGESVVLTVLRLTDNLKAGGSQLLLALELGGPVDDQRSG
ncbi:MAG: hypothetical protein ACRD4U_03760, partial [Candidatus Acidiferrales bacterium]